jgi:outer membrane protein TolC
MLLIASIVAAVLTFDDALVLARGAASTSEVTPSPVSSLRSHLPDVRLETIGNTSRTLHPFSADPLATNIASSVIAFDYPLWDGGVSSARIHAAESRLRMRQRSGGLDEARFTRVLEAFGNLYLAQRQTEIFRPVADSLSNQAEASARLLESGELSNVQAGERREVAISWASLLLDVEARRAEAAAQLNILLGIEGEPELTINFSEPVPEAREVKGVRDARIEAATIATEESRSRLASARAAAGWRATLSGSAGAASAQSSYNDATSSGTFGIYGLRVHLSYPIFAGTSSASIAEAEADLQMRLAAREEAIDLARNRLTSLQTRVETERKRAALLRESLSEARRGRASTQRLIDAGLRLPGDIARSDAELARREADLLSVEVARWKTGRLIEWLVAGPETVEP